MAETDNEPIPAPLPGPEESPELPDEDVPEQDAPEPTPTEPLPPPPIPPQSQARQRTVGGVHDLSNHPAVLSGQVLNAGDTALNRDPNASNFSRPVPQIPEAEEEATRSTTKSNPAKKTVRAKGKNDGAGPES